MEAVDSLLEALHFIFQVLNFFVLLSLVAPSLRLGWTRGSLRSRRGRVTRDNIRWRGLRGHW
jgi:hypothetical protein